MREQNIAFLSFSERGAALAKRLRRALGGTAACAHGAESFSLADWTREAFAGSGALVFVSAVGIAVRAVAPHLKSKATDPAVVAVDECGRFTVPVVSGHLGGANDLARAIAAVCGATAVITTATDANGLFAVDEWARRQDCTVVNPNNIKAVSAKILDNKSVFIRSAWPVAGEPPAGVALTEGGAWDVLVDVHRRQGQGLCLVPRALVLGVGCRRGTSRDCWPFAEPTAGCWTLILRKNCGGRRGTLLPPPLWSSRWAWTTSASAARCCRRAGRCSRENTRAEA